MPKSASTTSMSITVSAGDITRFKADALIVNLFEGVKKPGGGTGAVDKALDGAISHELKHSSAFTGKLGQTCVITVPPKTKTLSARYVVIVGLGKSSDFDSPKIRRASAAAIRACKKLQVTSVASILHGAGIGGHDVDSAARLVAEGTLLGAYEFKRRKTAASQKTAPPAVKKFTIVEFDSKKTTAIRKALKIGTSIATGVNSARDLVFDSPNHVTPTHLKKFAQNLNGLTVKILGRKDLDRLNMGAFVSVAKGSDEPPYLIHLSYKPTQKKPRKKVTIVGKGLTFDSGGLSLKPPKSQELMKMDMAGAAAVLGVMKAIGELGQLDIQVDGFVGTCENMPSARASKPGDIVTTRNGKTVEINNTDAEGRLVLADTMTYAQEKINPDEMVDLATLTGAQIVALGDVASAAMGTSQPLIESIQTAGQAAGEKFWQLPLYDEYKDGLKSDVADIINAGSKGQAGSISAGMFLKEFIDEGRNWVHLDIAGPAYTSKDQPEVPKGATGVGVRTLLYYLYELK